MLAVAVASTLSPNGINVEIKPKDVSFIAGYLSASLYDFPGNIEGHLLPDGSILASPTAKSRNDSHEVVWKVGLGLLAGAVVAFYDSDVNKSPVQFEDFVFGGLGGLTCIIIHF